MNTILFYKRTNERIYVILICSPKTLKKKSCLIKNFKDRSKIQKNFKIKEEERKKERKKENKITTEFLTRCTIAVFE